MGDFRRGKAAGKGIALYRTAQHAGGKDDPSRARSGSQLEQSSSGPQEDSHDSNIYPGSRVADSSVEQANYPTPLNRASIKPAGTAESPPAADRMAG